MKTVSILRPAAWAGVIPLVLGMQTALAEPFVYVPLGGEGKILVIDAARDEIVDTIHGVTAVHGLARIFHEGWCFLNLALAVTLLVAMGRGLAEVDWRARV